MTIPAGTAPMPGGGIARRPLHFIIAADVSGSMAAGGKIESLNYALATMMLELAAWERSQSDIQVLVRVIVFGNHAEWHIAEPTPPSQVSWVPLRCEPRALTRTGAALRLMATVLTEEVLERRALRPALLLVTDGIATDAFEAGLAALLATPGGAYALRIALAIGQDAPTEQLLEFSDPTLPVMYADRTEDIPELLRAMSMAASALSIVGADKEQIVQQLRSRADQSFV